MRTRISKLAIQFALIVLLQIMMGVALFFGFTWLFNALTIKECLAVIAVMIIFK